VIERLTLFNQRAHNLAREEKRLKSPRNPLKRKTLKRMQTLSNQVRKKMLLKTTQQKTQPWTK